jgi:polyphosphate kinase
MSALPPELFTNRELSWLAFKSARPRRGSRRAAPLLERVKFLAISASNLDEFFEIRVGGLLQQAEGGVDERGPDGLSPAEQLAAIARETHRLVNDQSRCWNESLLPALIHNGVFIRRFEELNGEGRARSRNTALARCCPCSPR